MTTILLVEDNEMNRDMLTRRLERKGYTVIAAIDGPSGIEMARTSLPDIILMDVALGDMDGWEATAILRADERTGHIPVIALTAHALETDRRRSIEVGCIDFETKPVSLADLVEKIEKHALHRAA
ncbi:MAG TPA: response regulator [Rhizomicrobium sp.]|jgi:CheY-like chemotaxis protein|nr:response regulator [Rhizomicrobium sp.]